MLMVGWTTIIKTEITKNLNKYTRALLIQQANYYIKFSFYFMGQQNNPQIPCQYFGRSTYQPPQDLVFYTDVEDHQFGKVSIYTSTKRPSSFIAKVQKTIENSKIYNIFQKIQNAQVPSLASLHAFEITRDKYFTGKIEQKITSFWEYYNFPFEEFLKMRFLRRVHFSQKELWLIIKACCESFSLFNYHNLVLDLDLKHIMVIPEKKLKIYWHHIELDNSHLRYYEKIKQIRRRRNSPEDEENPQLRIVEEIENENFYFSPEEIEGIEKRYAFVQSRQETMNVNFTRANSFRLGMILLYCITLTNPIKTCYGINRASGEKKIKIMVLNSLYETKVEASEKFSDDFKHLIKLLLLEDPNKRIPLDCLENVYEKFISFDSELEMGISDNPLYAPSSSRKNLRQEPPKAPRMDKNRRKSQSHHKKLSRHQSEKLLLESQVRSCQRQYGDKNPDLNNLLSNNDHEPFDKFDTKTIKISPSYQKR